MVLQLLMTLTYNQRNETQSIQKLKDMWGDGSGDMVLATRTWTRVQIPRIYRKARKLWQLTATQHLEDKKRILRASWSVLLEMASAGFNKRVPQENKEESDEGRRSASTSDLHKPMHTHVPTHTDLHKDKHTCAPTHGNLHTYAIIIQTHHKRSRKHEILKEGNILAFSS